MSEEIGKVLSEDNGSAAEPTKIKVGEVEYTAEELAAATAAKQELDEWSQKHGDWRALKAEFTKTHQEQADIERKAKLAKDITDGTTKATDLTAEELVDLAYIKKLVPQLGELNVEEIVAKAKEEALAEAQKAFEFKTTEEKINSLIKEETVKYPFVKEDELKNYLEEEAKANRFKTPHEAVLVKYEDQVLGYNKKPEDLPNFEKTDTKGRPEDPTPAKLPELGSPAMSERIKARLYGNKPVE
jgi:hypothetical protein